MADVTVSTLTVLIGKNNFTGRAVVYQCFASEHKTMLIHLQEDPLGPFIVILICGVDHTIPVKRKTNFFQLIGKSCNILVRDHTRMFACLDGIVLSRKSECIESNGEQHVVSFHSSLSGNYLKAGICLNMSYVHTCSARVRELYQTIELLLGTSIHCIEDLGIFPFLLPLTFYLSEIVFHFRASSYLDFRSVILSENSVFQRILLYFTTTLV